MSTASRRRISGPTWRRCRERPSSSADRRCAKRPVKNRLSRAGRGTYSLSREFTTPAACDDNRRVMTGKGCNGSGGDELARVLSEHAGAVLESLEEGLIVL